MRSFQNNVVSVSYIASPLPAGELLRFGSEYQWLHTWRRPPTCPSVFDASWSRQPLGTSSRERHVQACGPSNRRSASFASAGLAKDSFFAYTAISSVARETFPSAPARTEVAVRASGCMGFQRSRLG